MTTDTPLDGYDGHTPGPWEWSEHQFNAPPFEGALERECGIYPPLGESGPVAIANGKANARLISDAPKLLQRARTLERDLAECRAALAERQAVTFDEFRAANVTRCMKWHPQGIESWSPSDWLVAVTGELGELASLLKMCNRERDGLPGNKFSPTQKQIADEVADVQTYLDLLAYVLRVDIGRAVVSKFNEVSERVGFPDRIEPRALATKEPQSKEGT